MKYFFACLFSIFFLVKDISAQKHEGGILAGFSTYKGELNPVFLNKKFFSPAGGVFYRMNLNMHFALKTSIYYGRVWADDALSPDSFQVNRNLSFESEMLDVSQQIEFNFFPYQTGDRKHPFSPYIFIGISLFKFNPKAEFVNAITNTRNLEELQPLGTEGQGTTLFPDRREYALTQLSIPFGGGIKVSLGGFGIGLELGARKTFTDYIDDVSTTYPDQVELESQNGERAAALSDRSLSSDGKIGGLRGNPNDNDWYLFGGFTLYIKLDKAIDRCKPFNSKYE